MSNIKTGSAKHIGLIIQDEKEVCSTSISNLMKLIANQCEKKSPEAVLQLSDMLREQVVMEKQTSLLIEKISKFN